MPSKQNLQTQKIINPGSAKPSSKVDKLDRRRGSKRKNGAV